MEIPLASVIMTEDLGLEGTQRAGFAMKKKWEKSWILKIVNVAEE